MANFEIKSIIIARSSEFKKKNNQWNNALVKLLSINNIPINYITYYIFINQLIVAYFLILMTLVQVKPLCYLISFF